MANSAEYQRARRQQLADEGYCRVCAIRNDDRKPEAGYKTCHVCRSRSVESSKHKTSMRRYLRARGTLPPPDQFCVTCAAHGFHRDGCKSAPKATVAK